MSKFDMSDSGFFCEDGMPIPKGAISDSPHCWGLECNRATDMKPGIGDPPYGSICNLCNRSLRQHPFFGEGREYDLGNPQCVNTWRALSNQEKASVYAKYDFPIPRRLL